MKLSFSIKGWSDHTWSDFCDLALEMEFQGIELHNIHDTDFTAKGGPFHAHTAAATIRGLQEKKLSIPIQLRQHSMMDSLKVSSSVDRE